MVLESKALLQIQKPIATVFEGIVNPEIMTQYFISESSGRLKTGKTLIWKFPEFPDQFPITNVRVEKEHLITFVWDPETVVNITFEALPNQSTLVKVSEKGKVLNDANIEWALQNTGGWANFLACMKAYLEYGVHLREGAFDFMRTKV